MSTQALRAIASAAVAISLFYSSSALAGDLLVSSRFTSKILRFDSQSGSFVGVQFHPEKSGVAGVRWLGARVRALARGESPACR